MTEITKWTQRIDSSRENPLLHAMEEEIAELRAARAAPREPMTPEQAEQLFNQSMVDYFNDFLSGIRAGERFHGIKEKSE